MNIKIPSDEYNKIFLQYVDLHQKIIKNLNHCEKEISVLMHSKDGFYASLISRRLEEIVVDWRDVYIPSLEKSFQEMEETLQNYLIDMQQQDEE